jgi:hypothetical protein
VPSPVLPAAHGAPVSRPFRDSLALAFPAGATALAGAWLMLVAFTVVPAHDPARAVFWRVVAAAMLAFAALSAAALRPGPRRAPERVLLGTLGGIALGTGGGALVRLVTGGARFEGYLLVLALVVVTHGAAALRFSIRGSA